MNGGETVPCLVIDGKPMLESDDIVAWLESNVVRDS
jgi:glutaredoxin